MFISFAHFVLLIIASVNGVDITDCQTDSFNISSVDANNSPINLYFNTSLLNRVWIGNFSTPEFQFNPCKNELLCGVLGNSSFLCLANRTVSLATTRNSFLYQQGIGFTLSFHGAVDASSGFSVVTRLTLECGSEEGSMLSNSTADFYLAKFTTKDPAVCGQALSKVPDGGGNGGGGGGGENENGGGNNNGGDNNGGGGSGKDKESDNSPKANGLSGGDIFLVIFFTFTGLYILLGVLVKQSQGYTGIHSLPNYAFWSELPGLVKDGALYIWDHIATTFGLGNHYSASHRYSYSSISGQFSPPVAIDSHRG